VTKAIVKSPQQSQSDSTDEHPSEDASKYPVAKLPMSVLPFTVRGLAKDIPQKVALDPLQEIGSSEKTQKFQAPKSTKIEPLVGSKRLKGQCAISDEKEAS
jgi:hypothetical protein